MVMVVTGGSALMEMGGEYWAFFMFLKSLHSHTSTDSIDDLCNIHRPTISSRITPPSSASSHQAGINMVAELIRVTLGPRSRNVVLQNKYGPPKIVNDGEIVLKERFYGWMGLWWRFKMGDSGVDGLWE
ncbi:unnamed protein product [Lactuca saligna]|uniref:Uncharacterized protein n=1 Tax=Lactuca saligna TaxID=75948 RepID=A0AA35YLL4_LACSI|nr:unnamed protein product [Lactuca saligna]